MGGSIAVGAVLTAVGQPALQAVGFFLIFVWLIPAAFVVLYFAKPRPRVIALPSFAVDDPFVSDARVRIAFERTQSPSAFIGEEGVLSCIFVVGHQGFSARIKLEGEASVFEGEAQFLFPAKALSHFPMGTRFAVLWGRATIGSGEIIAAEGTGQGANTPSAP
jgi:hypothetical protein